MRRKSLSQYCEEIEDSFSWRKTELRNYKMVVENTKILSGRKSPLIRAGITLIYAHWEGFVSDICEIYLDFLNQKRCNAGELSLNLICLFIQQETRTFTNTYQASLYNHAIAKIVTNDEKLRFSTTIETKSNLRYDIFKEILWKIGLDDRLFSLKKELIDRKLLDNRNTIAHGKYCRIDFSDYLEIHNAILYILECLKDMTINLMVNNSHLRQTSTTVPI